MCYYIFSFFLPFFFSHPLSLTLSLSRSRRITLIKSLESDKKVFVPSLFWWVGTTMYVNLLLVSRGISISNLLPHSVSHFITPTSLSALSPIKLCNEKASLKNISSLNLSTRFPGTQWLIEKVLRDALYSFPIPP